MHNVGDRTKLLFGQFGSFPASFFFIFVFLILFMIKLEGSKKNAGDWIRTTASEATTLPTAPLTGLTMFALQHF